MILRLLALGLCLVAVREGTAEQPREVAKTTTKSDSLSNRKRIEALLNSPAKLDFGDDQKVTVRQILSELREKHELSFRFDTPTLASLSSQTAGGCPPAYSASYGVPYVGTMVPVTLPPTSSYYPPVDSQPLPTPKQQLPDPLSPSSNQVIPAATEEPVSVKPKAAAIEKLLNEEEEAAEAKIESSEKEADKPADLIDEVLDAEVDVRTLDVSRVSIATLLRHALDTAPTSKSEEFSGLPMLLTIASLLDYLVEGDGLLITTRMKALTTKETRVYSIAKLADSPDELAKMIRQSIRPWSWRAQITDLGDQLKGSPLPPETVTSLIKSGVQLVGGEVGVSVTPSVEEAASQPKPPATLDEARQMEMLGGAIANGLVTMAQSTLLMMEMVHYAEPPNGTIQVLGKRLIITQSQTAHREIGDLLEQLSDSGAAHE